ncbi:cytochrome P450 [Novosphingobium sp. JCM 18896]|uniref:cytochrome P450 n=1 Tax=Novosphingobium sp. JCM 18896 TaxID=2989731 RepID=UPI002223536F|nr:cytochrome P450 [Novosphingobium sp. JCM 18896]MCW1429623.1 cytochrome P450 [Novosphingobium sp. JCM 18896]
MQALADLDLYHLRWEEPAFAAEPLPEFAKARAKHPWIAKCDAGYVIFEYQAIRDLLVQDDKLRPSFDGVVEVMGAQGSPWGRFTEEQMIAMPEKEHTLMRGTFAAKFTPRYANQLRPLMRETMERLLKEWVPKGEIDFEEFASYYPVAVTTQMIGAPQSAIPGLRASMEAVGLGMSMDPKMLPRLDAAVLHLTEFSEELVAQRRANPKPADAPADLLDMLIEASDEGGISARQLVDLLIFLFVAGYDTSKNVFTYMMALMTEYPEVYERCAEDHEYCRKVVEEALRVFNPSSTFRFSKQDFVYRNVLIPADTMIFFTLNVSGRDPTAFERPDAFDPERTIDPTRRQLAFGMGRHMCLGQYIARAQLQEGIHLVAQHMRAPKLAGAPGWRPFPGVWGMKGLPIAFTPA